MNKPFTIGTLPFDASLFAKDPLVCRTNWGRQRALKRHPSECRPEVLGEGLTLNSGAARRQEDRMRTHVVRKSSVAEESWAPGVKACSMA